MLVLSLLLAFLSGALGFGLIASIAGLAKLLFFVFLALFLLALCLGLLRRPPVT